jgi:hypothetical protein
VKMAPNQGDRLNGTRTPDDENELCPRQNAQTKPVTGESECRLTLVWTSTPLLLQPVGLPCQAGAGISMDVQIAALVFVILAAASALMILAIDLADRKARARSSIEERLLKYEALETRSSHDPPPAVVWTLQQYDQMNGKPWCALLEQDAGGIRRGWTGYIPELENLARFLNVRPEELPPTTAQEFFERTNITGLRPVVPLGPRRPPVTPTLRRPKPRPAK